MTVGELRGRMDQREYLHWSAYYALQAQRQDLEAKKAKARKR